MELVWQQGNFDLYAECVRFDSDSKRHYWDSELWAGTHRVLSLREFAPSPLHEAPFLALVAESEPNRDVLLTPRSIQSLLEFYTTRPGDTDEEYFVTYSGDELKWIETSEFDEFCEEVRVYSEMVERGIESDSNQAILTALGFNHLPGTTLIEYLKKTQQQAIAWGLLDEVIDHTVSLPVAANKLRREIERARGIDD